MTNSKKIFMTGQPISEGSGAKFRHWILFLFSQLCFAISITALYLSMRGIMHLGGFVASGGPYHIAHQAPGWVWMLPVSIFLGLISVFVSFAAGRRIGGPNLMSLAWSALFLSLGWNFLEFFLSYGLELGKQTTDKELDKLGQKLQAMGLSTKKADDH